MNYLRGSTSVSFRLATLCVIVVCRGPCFSIDVFLSLSNILFVSSVCVSVADSRRLSEPCSRPTHQNKTAYIHYLLHNSPVVGFGLCLCLCGPSQLMWYNWGFFLSKHTQYTYTTAEVLPELQCAPSINLSSWGFFYHRSFLMSPLRINVTLHQSSTRLK